MWIRRRARRRFISIRLTSSASGRAIGFGGTQEATTININQIDPALARQLFPLGSGWDPAKLRESIPNPFFGIAAAGELGGAPTIQRGQLLRPFPEFGDVLKQETTTGSRRQYHAATFILEKRTGSGVWGGRLSYTLSNTKDNQFGQANNGYAWRTATPQNNYDLDAEYSTSI